jgi:hypothetical protein
MIAMTSSRLLRHLVLLGALMAPAMSSVAQQISVLPQVLLSRDTLVRVRVSTTSPFALGRESVTMVNNKFNVTIRSYDNSPDVGPAPPSEDVAATTGDVILGKYPQGSYTIEVLFLDRRNSILTSLGTAQFTVLEDLPARMSGYPAYDFTDLWWNPVESGWGISMHVKRDIFFAAWFVYDSAGNPTWYTLQGGSWQTPNRYSGLIYSTGANPNAGMGPLSALTVMKVGSGTLTFNGSDQAVFSFVVNGVEYNKNIMREVF